MFAIPLPALSLPDWLIAVIAAVYPAINPPPAYVYDGYIEADFVYAAASATGRIEALEVGEGDTVAEGALVFTLDDGKARAALRAAEAGLAEARAQRENLSTGARTAEADVTRAALDQARVAEGIAATRLTRSEALLARGSIAQAQVDDQRAALNEARAQVARLEAELTVQELPARDAQRLAAEAGVQAAQAQLDLARETLAERKVFAPVSGRVDRVFYAAGEVAGAGQPVMALFAPEAMTALFFVPEAERAALTVGAEVALSCEACAQGVHARITRLASDPQYAPPILYTREARDRLVFRVEAQVVEAPASGLLPGQPVTVDARDAVGE